MSQIIKLRMSFTGVARNAKDELADLQELAKAHPDYKDRVDFAWIDTCISAYHDTLLALMRGDVGIEEAKDFWLNGIEPNTVPYMGGAITFGPQDEAQATTAPEGQS